MKIEIEDNQLFIHYKMPDLEHWNPRPGTGKYKGEEENEIPLKKCNSKYNTINNKHKRFILNKIYFVVIHFWCNQYFSLHTYILGIPMHL